MQATGQVRVVLADRAGKSRTILARMLTTMPGVNLVGEADDGDDLARLLRTSRPDVVIVDDRVFGERPMAPIDAAVRVIVVGMDDAPAYSERALGSGAYAWILKEQADDLLPPMLLPRP